MVGVGTGAGAKLQVGGSVELAAGISMEPLPKGGQRQRRAQVGKVWV